MSNCDKEDPQPCYFSQFDKWRDVDHTKNVKCCSICDTWMCDYCRPMYKERVKAAAAEQADKFKRVIIARAKNFMATVRV